MKLEDLTEDYADMIQEMKNIRKQILKQERLLVSLYEEQIQLVKDMEKTRAELVQESAVRSHEF